MLKKISSLLQLLVNALIVILAIWVVFYAFQANLPNLIGAQLFFTLYHFLSTLVSIFAVMIIILAVIFALISRRN